MTFGLSAAALGAIAVGGATIVSGFMQSNAASKAADIQGAAAGAGISETQRQFDAVQKILQPFVAVGAPALEQQQALLGLRGPEAERAAIERISGGEQFKALAGQGEEALLQRASATGGLRGGNIQAALGQFRPQLLSNLIEKQYGQLGGLATLGQSSAAGVGTAGMNTGANIANLLGQQGAAQAGGEIAQGRAYGSFPTALASGLGIYSGLGGRFAPSVIDDGYSIGLGSAYGGRRAGF
ncbi:hypothetical protein UFOVP1377_20 [uncultured Caudovirales phage]|uniref:Uncharacterized protein n=1 Tax=uncultured Caudovirales phage TaxID=2100421 RepID=A0A6J5N1F4_9CAUD|nr:hypothetical protein UFOVP604_16 [uncultured Caudovirales phage]CAB4183873.1 hypothetical protein UFOVP1108_16 [uncultured Caudovirales phage]CAB4202387.1 hypothetical protein UFOVP1377_20 [uncultured Caudovirales phage]CAB4215659.1 hypothetical protein UFOVP1472_31 [uncultured Caudovirales phage]CAB5229745.1 hypothetical protein UFOVP1559_7 [uncultured Caudovirales phage]